jgi:NADH dehydrogenase FAD-containing subunit
LKRLVLAGAGPAHAQVLLAWARKPLVDTELLLVSPIPRVPYAGGVAAWIAGRKSYDEICIDYQRLASAAGARFVADELVALDAKGRQIGLRDGGTLAYDVLSLEVGTVLQPPLLGPSRVLPMWPLSRLHTVWEALLADWTRGAALPQIVTAVGGGAAGVETLLAVLQRLRELHPKHRYEGRLLTRSPVLLPGLSSGAVDTLNRALEAAGVTVLRSTIYDEAMAQPGELLLWATGAHPQAWLMVSGLALNGRGHVRINPQLRSASHPQVYAVGECAAWGKAQPQAGLQAELMAPVLAHNLRAALGGGRPRRHAPPSRVLTYVDTADGRAVASWWFCSASGRWVWRRKNRRDLGWLRRLAGAPAAAAAAAKGS